MVVGRAAIFRSGPLEGRRHRQPADVDSRRAPTEGWSAARDRRIDSCRSHRGSSNNCELTGSSIARPDRCYSQARRRRNPTRTRRSAKRSRPPPSKQRSRNAFIRMSCDIPTRPRPTFGVCPLEAGVDLLTISRLLGHSSFATTMRYLHCRREHLHSTLSIATRK